MENSNLQKENEYFKLYSEKTFFEKIKHVAMKAGIKVIYGVLLLYYTLQKPLVPKWAKRTIIGALGYFIVPIDLIPDFVPAGGYVDDLSAIILALGAVTMFIDEEVKKRAKNKLAEWFGRYDESLIKEVESEIKSK